MVLNGACINETSITPELMKRTRSDKQGFGFRTKKMGFTDMRFEYVQCVTCNHLVISAAPCRASPKVATGKVSAFGMVGSHDAKNFQVAIFDAGRDASAITSSGQ